MNICDKFMMASPSEVTPSDRINKPHNYCMLLKSFEDHQTHHHAQKLEDFLAQLEEEMLKIDAFKRELPLCIQLLTNVMEASRQELMTYRVNHGQGPVLEEFIPIKHSSSECCSEKANWRTSAQPWSQASDAMKNQQPPAILTSPRREAEIGFNIVVGPKLALDDKQRNGGAFLPFFGERGSAIVLPELALASPDDHKEMDQYDKCSQIGNGITWKSEQGQGGGGSSVPADLPPTTTTAAAAATTQIHRKARRCWSPDLHRRFVNALQVLGGSQATPKQIRELMKVDGLTTDEVKSHLQKYRLHTRRPSLSPQESGAPAIQLVVTGGIWVPAEYATAAAAAHSGAPPGLYSAHPTTTIHASQYCAPPLPQEFYAAAPPQVPHRTHHLYKPSPQTHSSPESDIKAASDRSESIEDGKSESSSLKADSAGGGGGGERKELAALVREEGEESINGSEITLKF